MDEILEANEQRREQVFADVANIMESPRYNNVVSAPEEVIILLLSEILRRMP